jgi:hypothetical protein
MKKLLFLLCISCVIHVQAQELKMEFLPAGDIENDVESVHKYGNKFYTDKTDWGKMQFAFSANLKKVKYGVDITQYDEQLNKLKKLSIDNGKNELGPFRPIVYYGSNAIYVTYFRFTEDDEIKIFVSKVNPDDLTVTATREVMAYDQKNQAVWGTVKTIGDTRTFYKVSEDEKQAWIIHASSKLILSTVIDADLKPVQKTESVPVELKDLEITGIHMGNDGNKVLVYKYKDAAVKEFDTRGLFFQPANENGAFQTIKLPAGYFPGNLVLKLLKDGRKLYLGGEYYGEEYDDAGKGVLLAEVNMKTQSFSTPVFYPYTAELKQRVFDLDFAVKSKGEIVFKDHHLNYEVNEMENGTVVLSSDMFVTSGSMEHQVGFRGPVVHVFIKPGANASMTLIPKKQGASYTGFSNYIFKDKLICLYVDIPKFQEKELEDKQIGLVRNLGGLVPVANVYDAEGKLISRKMVLESRKGIKGSIETEFGSKIGDNKFVFLVTSLKANMVKAYTSVNQLCFLQIF